MIFQFSGSSNFGVSLARFVFGKADLFWIAGVF